MWSILSLFSVSLAGTPKEIINLGFNNLICVFNIVIPFSISLLVNDLLFLVENLTTFVAEKSDGTNFVFIDLIKFFKKK